MNELDEISFKEYAKTPRLFGNKGVIVSEKLDGTNAAIQIIALANLDQIQDEHGNFVQLFDDDAAKVTAIAHDCAVIAQSRKRIITPEFDNFGFARWVSDNAEGLVEALGTGIHRGEWYGSGIQRGYGLPKGEKRFALFAIDRYIESPLDRVSGLSTVPELWRGMMDTNVIRNLVAGLVRNGSLVAPGFKAEGVIVFHEASQHIYKVMCEDDSIHKGE